MTENTILSVLKSNLQMLTDANDPYLRNLIKQAIGLMEREGITDDKTDEYYMAVNDYAAFLFRKRASKSNVPMSKSLRYELNVLLFSQKSKSEGE